MKTRICSRYKEKLPLTREYFYYKKRGKYGFGYMCIKCTKEYVKKYRELDPEKKHAQRCKEWRENDPEKIRDYYENKRKTNLKYNLNYKMRKAIKKSLKGNKAGRTWESLTGYTLTDLKRRLNETMPEGYNWGDYLTARLHIDHIIPISAFNFTKPEHTDFKRCWALNNLRLLPARENIIKWNHLDKPFQPALRI